MTRHTLVAPGRTIGVIGAGVMGQTLIKGLLKADLIGRDDVWATAKTQETCDEVAATLGIPTYRDYKPAIAGTDILLLCVKPSQISSVLGTLREAGLSQDTLVVSILAGVTTEQLESGLEQQNPCVRAMPNTPCVVGQGMTVVCAGRYASAEQVALAKRIFSAVGRCEVVDEQYCNAITALSGSGPAYMYLVIEALADAGVRVGLPRDLALMLVAQTMLGSARMVLDSDRHPASLRDDVTTPAGCTIGGLLMLEDGKIRSVLARAVEEATRIVERLGRPAARTEERRA